MKNNKKSRYGNKKEAITILIRRTEGTEEQGVSDSGYLSFLAS